MRKLLFIFSLIVAGGLVYTDSLSGQQVQESEGSLLPDIDPQDIEIRSQYRARFPGLRRQPILGFRPGSRVFQVDPDRTPFLEDEEDIAAQLPVSEYSRPEAPEYLPFPYATPTTGYGRLGFGNYMSPEAEFYVNSEVADNQWLSGSMRHTSGDGHLDDQYSSFRYFDFGSEYRGKVGERTVLGASLGVNSDFNYLPRLQSETNEFGENPGRKSYSNLTFGTRLKRYQNTIEHLDIGFNTWASTIDLDEEELGYTSSLSDWGVALDGGYTWAGSRIYELFGLYADLQAGGYELIDEESEGWYIAGGGAKYQRMLNYQTKLDLGFGLYSAGDTTGNSTLYLAPDVKVEHYLSNRITLAAYLNGKPEHPGHYDYHLENRFLLPDNELKHSYNLKAGAQITVEYLANNKIRAGVSFQNSKNYPYYHREDFETGFPLFETIPGHYVIDYANVTIPRAFAGISVDLIPERFWFDVEGYVQRPRLGSDERVPFEENYGFNGAITVRPIDRLLFEGWGNITGGRITSDETELSSYLLLGTKLELRLTERVGVYGKILNPLNQEYEIWQGFNERPFQVYGGITLKL